MAPTASPTPRLSVCLSESLRLLFSLIGKKPVYFRGSISELEQEAGEFVSVTDRFSGCILKFPGSTANAEPDTDPGIEEKKESFGKSWSSLLMPAKS